MFISCRTSLKVQGRSFYVKHSFSNALTDTVCSRAYMDLRLRHRLEKVVEKGGTAAVIAVYRQAQWYKCLVKESAKNA